LSQGIATLAAAFYPRDVILRFSDFKTNEYCHLLGGADFEPKEENPMLGWRGASRYYHPNYKEGFLLEVAAVRRVREVYGLKNLKVMIPFCRTPKEGAQVLEVMREGGLASGKDGLEVAQMDALALGFAGGSFDWACSSHLIEHFDDPEGHVRELARVLDHRGTVFFLTPNAPADFENPFTSTCSSHPSSGPCSSGTSRRSRSRGWTPSPT